SAPGLSAISLRNSGHGCRVGEWAERAAAAGLISIHFVNAAGSVLVAPFGGLERRVSDPPVWVGGPPGGGVWGAPFGGLGRRLPTAPFGVGAPRGGAEPVVLDFATSLVAEGKVNV